MHDKVIMKLKNIMNTSFNTPFLNRNYFIINNFKKPCIFSSKNYFIAKIDYTSW